MKWPYENIGVLTTRAFRNLLNKIFGDIGADMQEQKDRVDNLINGTEQQSEVIDMHLGRDGQTYPVARDMVLGEIGKTEAAQAQINQDTAAQLADEAKQRQDEDNKRVMQINYDADRAFTNSQIAAISSPFGQSYETLDELNIAHPISDGKNHIVTSENNYYFWIDGAGWTSGGGIPTIGDGVVTPKTTNFAKRINILDAGSARIGYSTGMGIGITLDEAVIENPNNVLFYKIPVKPNTTYKIYSDFLTKFTQYNKTQLSILQFKSNGVSTVYTPIAGNNYSPELTTEVDTAYINLALNNVDTNSGYYQRLMMVDSDFIPTRFYQYGEININKWEDRLSYLETDRVQFKIKNACKLIEDAGTIYNLDSLEPVVNCSVIDDGGTKKYANKAKRVVSVYTSDGFGRVKLSFDKPVSFNSLTLVFFAYDQTNSDAKIRVDLSADGNYSDAIGTHLNGRYEQGINYLKLTRPMFSGVAPATIKALYITISARNTLNVGDKFGILTLDSVIVDQKMRPVVLLSLDQLHQESFDNGAYQYALDNNVPFSLFCGDWQNVQQSWIDWCKKIEYENGCELGCYGGYTGDGANNLVVANATDYRTAKDNLDLSYNKFTEIFCHEPFSYAAAQGILTPVNKPAIRDAGFVLARGGVTVYTGYLDKYSGSISQWGLGYDKALSIIQGMIDNAIQYNYCIDMFTHGVFDGATEPDYMHLDIWEGMIDYIVQKRDEGSIDVMTHKQFYDACVK
ncbi:hypothetical protein [Sporolactobacillus terrae]|uniref:hypothetical protein n=1 Tax=Sporolactobacillus terrae TaxID=269673 RepID=UPI00048EEAD2|nr:hypothetical protein [Sporolactobacillus terrae]